MARKGSQRARTRCPGDGKTTFRTYVKAERVAAKVPDDDNRVYWCQAGGGYHFTRSTVEEYSRRRATKQFEEEPSVQIWQLPGRGVERIGLGGDCPTCGWLYGFHDPVVHAQHQVPRNLIWAPGSTPLWADEESAS